MAIPHGAPFWFRRFKFTHATVLTSTIRHCCRKFRVGACCVCRSMHAKCGCQRSVTFSEFCFLHMDIWYCECHVTVLGVAFFVQSVCVCVFERSVTSKSQAWLFCRVRWAQSWAKQTSDAQVCHRLGIRWQYSSNTTVRIITRLEATLSSSYFCL